MNKTCARCEKTVYPTEELKCLDKVWHKGCFKCQECGMTLNMRTYKGYGKLPYCESHVPKAKHTTMAETPELRRIAENTKIQSNVKYHADFERSKGKFTQVADDPETLRIKANTKIISNVAYHGELEKKAQMEKQRTLNENGEIVELPTTDNYHQQIENYATEMLAPNTPTPTPTPTPKSHQPATNHRSHHEQTNYRQTGKYDYQPSYQQNMYEEYNQQYLYQQQQQQQQQQHQQQQHQQQHHQQQQQQQHHQQQQHQQQQHHQQQQQYQHQQQQQGSNRIGRIQDYDPLSDGPRVVPNTQRASATLIYNSTNDGKPRGAHQSAPQQQSGRAIGRVTDMDPLAGEHQHRSQRAPLPPTNTHINGRVYMALYDYEAGDTDEVSFREGDLISNVSSIDEGWMTGQVLRTGRTGMLPANYVQIAPM